jgi:NAD(P)-dependent dehydrogenase (short-subunit alcohol dehydrogenase family)
MSEPLSFQNQVAIVTGAGRSMGRTHALDLARRGAGVVVNDVIRENADAVVAEITEAGGRAVASYDSVGTQEGGAALVELAVARFGSVDVVVHNAGILRNDHFEHLTLEQIESVLDVHLKAAFFVGQPAYRIMKEKGYGRIVLISSTSGIFGLPGNTNYAAAKAGLFGLSNALALEGREHGVFVNCVLPKSAGHTIAKDKPIPGMDYTEMPIDARKTPESVTAMVTFLASRECPATGEVFSACAGRYARVFVGVARGWLAPDVSGIRAEDIREHFDEIEDHGFDGLVPRSIYEELAEVTEMLESAGYLPVGT